MTTNFKHPVAKVNSVYKTGPDAQRVNRDRGGDDAALPSARTPMVVIDDLKVSREHAQFDPVEEANANQAVGDLRLTVDALCNRAAAVGVSLRRANHLIDKVDIKGRLQAVHDYVGVCQSLLVLLP